tara:strand:- start:160 stop:312 length:153 start_codon:yes stop_codon:yes gene_type:complete
MFKQKLENSLRKVNSPKMYFSNLFTNVDLYLATQNLWHLKFKIGDLNENH